MKPFSRATVMALACLTAAVGCVSGQTYDPGNSQYPQYVQYPQSMPPVTPGVPAGQVALSGDQLDQLLAPIALYPDPLLSMIFPAATYPQDVAAAEQWLQSTPQPTEDAINAQPWDESIKGLVHYPTVLKMMNDQMDWTNAVGAAFVNQQQDVMDSVQRLRVSAQVAQNLQNNQQEQIITDADAIRIEPVSPDIIYVPQYDPNLVYVSPCPITFGIGFPLGLWCDDDFDWNRRCVVFGAGFFNGWRHPDAWDRRWPQWDHTRAGAHFQPHDWTRAPLRPAPRLTPAIVTRTGLDKPRVSPARRPDVVSHLPARIVAPQTPRPATPNRIGNPATGTPAPSGNVFQPQNRTTVPRTPSRPTTPTTPRVNPVKPVTPPTVTPTPPTPRISTPRPVTPATPRVVSPPAVRPTPPAVRPTPPVVRTPAAPRISVPASPPQNVFRGSSGGQTRTDSNRGRSSTHH